MMTLIESVNSFIVWIDLSFWEYEAVYTNELIIRVNMILMDFG